MLSVLYACLYTVYFKSCLGKYQNDVGSFGLPVYCEGSDIMYAVSFKFKVPKEINYVYLKLLTKMTYKRRHHLKYLKKEADIKHYKKSFVQSPRACL